MKKWIAVLAVLAVFGIATAHAGFMPSDVASVTAWFDPSDLSKLSLDTGNEVNSWTDSTTSPITASNTGTARPIYSSNGFGAGLPGLSFDGANDRLATAGAAADAKFTTAANFFAVVKRAADESTQGGDTVISYGSSGGGGNTNYIWQVDRGGTPGPTAYPNVYAGGGWRDGNANVDTSVHILELSFQSGGGGGYAFYIDGVAAGTNSNMTAWSGSPNPDQFFIGVQLSVNFWNGLLGDIVLSNAVLGADDRNKVGEYLETLYGLDTEYEADLGNGNGGAIPEPAGLGLLGVALLGLRKRRP